MHLVTAGLWDEVPTDEKLLLLGTWCLPPYGPERSTFDENHEYQVMESLWRDRDCLAEHYQIAIDTVDSLLPKVAEYLNQVHRVEFDNGYWRCLIGWWLSRYVPVAIDRFLHIKKALELYPDLRTVLLSRESYQIPLDSDEYIQWADGSDWFSLQIYSEALRYLGHNDVSKGRIDFRNSYDSSAVERPHSDLILSTLEVSPKLVKKAMLSGLYCHPAVENALLKQLGESFSRFEGFSRESLNRAQPSLDAERLGLQSLASDGELEGFVIQTLPYVFPAIWLENYHTTRAQVLIQYPDVPSMLLTANAHVALESFKFLAGEVVRLGGRYMIVQHGGGYGISELAMEEVHERAVASEFWCWGWGAEDNPSVKNISCLKVSSGISLEEQYEEPEPNDEVLFVATATPKNAYKLCSYFIGADWNDRYMPRQNQFFRGLSGRVRERVRFRGYQRDYGLGIAQRVKEDFPNFAYDDDWSYPLWRRMRESRVVVIDHLATSYLEALAMNVPTVFTWDPAICSFRPEVEQIFERLADVGVFQKDAGQAAAHVNQIYDDPMQWWMSEPVQTVRSEFVNRFVRVSHAWFREWSYELWSAFKRSSANVRSVQPESSRESSRPGQA